MASAIEPSTLDASGFGEWAERLLRAAGRAFSEQEVGDLMMKATAVIDHDCRDYVEKYCDAASLETYVKFVESDEATPWAVVAKVISLKPDPKWRDFVEEDAKKKLGRFGEIMIDPSIAS